jgi:c-di-GMP-binding flagellar brake protein YcgR
VDYSGLSILAIAHKNVANHDGVMKFCNVSLHIRELFRIVQMDRVFQCYETEEQGLLNFDEKILELERRMLRRRFKRLEININLTFGVKTAKDKVSHWYKGQIVNISGAGMFISSPNIFPIRTQLKIEISLPRELAPIEMDGMVIWVSDKNLQPHCYPGMGVQFMNMDFQKQKELLDFIDKNITHRSET